MKSYYIFKKYSFSVGGRLYSSVNSIRTATSFNKKTGKEIRRFKGDCSLCKITESEIVSDNTIGTESSGNFFESIRKRAAKAAKKLAIEVAKNSSKALELAADSSFGPATRNSKAKAATTPSVRKFIHQRSSLYSGKIQKGKIIVETFFIKV